MFKTNKLTDPYSDLTLSHNNKLYIRHRFIRKFHLYRYGMYMFYYSKPKIYRYKHGTINHALVLYNKFKIPVLRFNYMYWVCSLKFTISPWPYILHKFFFNLRSFFSIKTFNWEKKFQYYDYSQKLKFTISSLPIICHKFLIKVRIYSSIKPFKWEKTVHPVNYSLTTYFLYKIYFSLVRFILQTKKSINHRTVLTLNKNFNVQQSSGTYILPTTVDLMQNFGHFFMDALPNIHWCETNLSKKYSYIVPEHSSLEAYILPTLKTLGITEDRCYAIPYKDVDTVYEFDKIITTSQLRCYYAIQGYYDSLYTRLRNYYVHADIYNKYKQYKRIFLARKTRDISNRDEIINLLRSYGFHCVFMEDYSFIDRVNLLYNVEVIISISGANLNNINLCRPGTKLITIENGDFPIRYLELVYHGLGYDYYYVPVDTGLNMQSNVLQNMLQKIGIRKEDEYI